MALIGKLEDIKPAEIMVYIGDSMKTGKLIFSTGTQEGLIVFRDGKIIYAASSSIRETFGSIALNLGLINNWQLEKAVQKQHVSGEERRLGEILADIGAMRDEGVRQVLEHQVSEVVREIFEWQTGYFRFKNLEIEDFGDIEVGARDFVAGTGLDTRSVALDAARELDESARDHGLAVQDDGGDDEPETPTTLGQIMAEVAGPALTGETIREIFTIAATTLDRGILLAVHENNAHGVAAFGLEDGILPPAERVRQLNIPLNEYSLLSGVVRDRELFRRQPDHIRTNTRFFYALGGEWPEQGIAIPMVINERVAMVFYGDNAPKGLPVGETTDLEACLKTVCARLEGAGQ